MKRFDLTSEVPIPGLEIYYEEFLATRIDELETVKSALNVGNYQVITDLAHKWKGFSAPYGFGILGQLAMKIEKCLEGAEIEYCRVLIDEVEFYLTITKTITKEKG